MSDIEVVDQETEHDETDRIMQSRVVEDLGAFLQKVTTNPDHGACFPSDGLVPPRNNKLYNPILAAFIQSLKPTHSQAHFDLLTDILQATPELIAEWTQNTKLDFTPDLNEGWIRGMQLFEWIAELPFPATTLDRIDEIPAYVLLENIFPTPIARIATKALQHESSLVRLMMSQVLASCMKKAHQLKVDNEKALDVLDTLQSRVPLVESIVPLASVELDIDADESDVLLRQKALVTLELYLSTFDDVPNFDFSMLFNRIMSMETVSILQNSSMLQDNCSVERKAVLNMLGHVRDLQWWKKRKGTRSIFLLSLQYAWLATKSASQAAIKVIFSVLQRDSIAFKSNDSPSSALPCRLQALFKPFEYDKVLFTPQNTLEIFDYIDDCMVRFQADPYRYWDQFVDLCVAHDLDTNADFDLFMMTLHEQLQYVKGKKHIEIWLSQALAHMVSVGANKKVSETLLTRNLPFVKPSAEVSLYNGVVTLLRMLNHNTDDEEFIKQINTDILGPDSHMEDSNVVEDHLVSLPGEISLDHQSRIVKQCLKVLDAQDHSVFKQFLLDSCDSEQHIDGSIASEILECVAVFYSRIEFVQSEKLPKLLKRLLPLQLTPGISLNGLLDTQTAISIISDYLSNPALLSPYAKASLLDCLQDSAQSKIITSLFLQLFDSDDCLYDDVLSAIERALSRKVLEYLHLSTILNLSGHRSDLTDRLVETPDTNSIATLLATYIRTSDLTDFPLAFVNWTTMAPLGAASMIITELSRSRVQEVREIGLQILTAKHFDLCNLIEQPQPLRADIIQCILEKLKIDPETRSSFINGCPRLLSTISPINENLIRVMASIDLNDTELDAIDHDSQLSAYHNAIVDLLVRRFAQDRAQEQKELSREIIDFLSAAVSYVKSSSRFASDASSVMLTTMVDAALENQLGHAQVVAFITAIVQSTSNAAFNYTRTIQSLIAQSFVFRDPDTSLYATQLLHAMISHDPKLANINVLDAALVLYQGTVQVKDQLLFQIIKTLEATLATSIGTRFKRWRLVESLEEQTLSETAVEAVLSTDMALYTILHFRDHDSAQANAQADKIYDIRWILSLTRGFMTTDSSNTMLEQLLQHHGLGLAFIGLSSNHLAVRIQSSHMLSAYHTAISGSRIYEKTQMLMLLDSVQSSVVVADLENEPIPLLQSVFLALATQILLDPTHFLYAMVNQFILARAQFDMTDVPMFMNLFYCRTLYSTHILWLIKFLCAGIKPGEDGPYRRRHVLELFMGLYRSSTANPKIKDGIRQLMGASVETPGMREYFDKVAGRAWVTMSQDEAIKTSPVLPRL